MKHAIIHGELRVTGLEWPLATLVINFFTDSDNPDFRDGAAAIANINFSQSQEDINLAIAQGLVDYLSSQTGEDFDAGDVRGVGAASTANVAAGAKRD